MSHVESERNGAVQRIAINRPEKRMRLRATCTPLWRPQWSRLKSMTRPRPSAARERRRLYRGHDLEDF